MKEITILSGKGGAGKTMLTAALATLATNAVFCDNDVDAADLHLIFKPKIKESYTFSSGTFASINTELCTQCGLCEESCRFMAIHNKNNIRTVNPFQCEGCRLCERICPVQAINSQQNFNNKWFVSTTRFGYLVHAKMGAGEENSGKLVSKIRERAKEIAQNTKAQFVINDGPPGIGCTAISSITGTDAVLLVIEPSVSGLHDAKRAIKLIHSFQVPVFAIINKFDINEVFTQTVEDYLEEEGIAVLGKIPFTTLVVESIIQSKTVIEYVPEKDISKELKLIWNRLYKSLHDV